MPTLLKELRIEIDIFFRDVISFYRFRFFGICRIFDRVRITQEIAGEWTREKVRAVCICNACAVCTIT